MSSRFGVCFLSWFRKRKKLNEFNGHLEHLELAKTYNVIQCHTSHRECMGILVYEDSDEANQKKNRR